MDWSQVPQTHRFVPLGFEAAGGAFGRATLDFLREVEAVAGDQSSAAPRRRHPERLGSRLPTTAMALTQLDASPRRVKTPSAASHRPVFAAQHVGYEHAGERPPQSSPESII